MFRSAVFWMGLVFIPVTSLVFDVAYKVWVSHVLHRTTKAKIKSTGCLISPREITEFKRRPLEMFSFPSREHASRNIHNVAAPSQVDTSLQRFLRVRNNLKRSLVFPGLGERRWYQKKKDLKCQFEDSVVMRRLSVGRVKRVCFKTLVDEVQELEALSKDPGAVVHGKRYCLSPLYCHNFRFIFYTLKSARML